MRKSLRVKWRFLLLSIKLILHYFRVRHILNLDLINAFFWRFINSISPFIKRIVFRLDLSLLDSSFSPPKLLSNFKNLPFQFFFLFRRNKITFRGLLRSKMFLLLESLNRSQSSSHGRIILPRILLLERLKLFFFIF